MLDHVFTDAIGAIRDAFEAALLERQAFEERFTTDVLLGDTTWATSYGLPGEGSPPRVQADVTMVWPTWSQTTYRSWYIGEEIDEPPRITIELVFRIQRLVERPEPREVLASLPDESPAVGADVLVRDGVSVEALYDADFEGSGWAIEVSYAGEYEVREEVLADGGELDTHFSGLGGWISSVLVQLGDVRLAYRPADDAS